MSLHDIRSLNDIDNYNFVCVFIIILFVVDLGNESKIKK